LQYILTNDLFIAVLVYWYLTIPHMVLFHWPLLYALHSSPGSSA